MTPIPSNVGFVGLGNMGGAIAQRLLQSGQALHLYDKDPPTVSRLAAFGGTAHSSARGVADAAEIVFVCLPSPKVSKAALDGDDGLSAGSRMRVLIETGTIGPVSARAFAAELAAGGVAMLDAPVSGGAAAALAGTLTMMVSGPAELRNAVSPLLAKLTSSVIVIGDAVGDAQTMKLINNLLAAANMATAFEALVLGAKLGLRPTKMVEVISRSSGASTGITSRRVDSIRLRRFDNGGKIALLDKDVALAFEQAKSAGFPVETLTALNGMADLWKRAVALGMASEDVTALIKVIERAAGVEVRESDAL